MSDYIVELRRELVEAADREQRSRAPRRAVRRSRRLLAPVLAGAAALAGAVAVTIGLQGEDRPPLPARPQVQVTLKLDGKPAGATLGPSSASTRTTAGTSPSATVDIEPGKTTTAPPGTAINVAPGQRSGSGSSVWVLRADGALLEIDPQTDQLIRTEQVAGTGVQLSASQGNLWAVARQGHSYRVTRLRMGGLRQRHVVRGTGVLTGLWPVSAASSTALWLQGDPQLEDNAPLLRVDASSGRVDGAFTAPTLSAIAADTQRVWTLSQSGTLEWRDAHSGRVVGRRSGFAPLADATSQNALASADDGGAYVATAGDGVVTRVSADGETRWRADVDADGPVAAAPGALWASQAAVDGAPGAIARLDQTSGKITQRMPLERSQTPTQLVPVSDELWAILNDGTVLVLR